jgi:16S rRNA processing protein RimM
VHVVQARAALLTAGARVVVEGRERVVARRAGTDERPIVRLEGCEDRDAAEALRGAELLVARGAAPALGEDEWWPEELEGCRVTDGAVEVGVVERVSPFPSCDVLEVARLDGGALLVPLVRDAVRSVDVEARRVDVDLRFLEGPA